MKKGENVLRLNETIENLRKTMSPNKRLENKFDYFLRENDLFYEDKVKFEISHSNLNKYYKIKIFPIKEGFNSQEYFGSKFWDGQGRDKLGNFNKENNVGVVSY
jgi:hypothetical protein